MALVVASALTFMLMGITVPHAFTRARRLARHGFGGMALLLLLLCLPLGLMLRRQLDLGRAQPLGYPVPRVVHRALEERIAQDEGVSILLLGRSAVEEAVGVWLVSAEPLTEAYRHELRDIVRAAMRDSDLEVRVVAVQSAGAD